MKRLVILFVVFFLCLNASSQVCFKGKIETKVKGKLQPVDFASVVLTSTKDTLKVLASSISDSRGEFVFNKLKIGRYRISISMLGYRNISKNIRVNYPSVGNVFNKHYLLEQSSVNLDEVSVVGVSSKQGLGKTTYLITRSDIKKYYSGAELVSKIPELNFDKTNQKVVVLGGGVVKVLIDGINASPQELMSIDPKNIKSIDYYDFPPARYIGASRLIDVKTKHTNDGFYSSVNLQHALTTTFGNDGLYMQYNWGNNKLSFNGYTYLRDYTDIDYTNSYKYSISKVKYERSEYQDRKFGYDDNNLSLTYTKNVKDKYDLQVKFSPNFQNQHIDGDLDIIQKVDRLETKRNGLYKLRTHQFTPSLDLYTKIYLPNKQDFIYNIHGTYSDANQKDTRFEYDNNKKLLLGQVLDQDNKKKSLINQINYNKNFGFLNLSIGNYNYYGLLESNVLNNNKEFNYETKVITNKTYSELSGMFGSFMYRLTLGANYYYNSTNSDRYNLWTFEPRLMLVYKLNKKSMLNLIYVKDIAQPSLGQISSNKILITNEIVKEGNPSLKNSISDGVAFLYLYQNSIINFKTGFAYENSRNAINSYFIQDKNDIISLRYENAEYQNEYGVQGLFVLNPFKNNLLKFKLAGSYKAIKTKSPKIGTYTYYSSPLDYTIEINKGRFLLSYRGNIRSKKLNGPYVIRNEKTSTICLSYSHKNFSMSIRSIFFLVDTEYKTNTIPNSIVDYTSLNNINDNKSMFTIGLSYRFSLGKGYKDSNRSINNSDTDAGMFN